MPIAVVVAAFLSFMVAVGVRNFSHPPSKITPTSTVATVTTTVSPTGEQLATPSSQAEAVRTATPKPTGAGTVKLIGTSTATIKPNQGTTSTPTPTTPVNTPTPTPAGDTTPPKLEGMTGPENGSTVPYTNFCFPMRYSDATSPIMVRFAFDSDSLGDWGQNYAPCYQNVSNGTHSFSVQAKDGVGNMTGTIKRTFTVQVTSPTPQASTPTPTTQVTQ